MLPEWVALSQDIHIKFSKTLFKDKKPPWVKTKKIDKCLEEHLEGLKAAYKTLTHKLTHFEHTALTIHATSAIK